MPRHFLPLPSGRPWTGGIRTMGCGQLGPGPLLFPRPLSCPRARPEVYPVPSMCQFCAGAGGPCVGTREGLPPSGGLTAWVWSECPGSGQKGSLPEEKTAEELGCGLGTWAAGIQTSTLPPGWEGTGQPPQMRCDHCPIFPKCSGCRAQRAHFPERVIAARVCRVAVSQAGAEGVIRALTLGLEFRGLPRTSGLDGLCLLLGSEGSLERKKKRLVQFLF